MKKKKNQRKNSMLLVYILLVAVVFMVAGYAILSNNISVTGTATADANFTIAWGTPTMTDSWKGTVTPALSVGDTVLTMDPALECPGAFVEVTADVMNNGNLDAEITGVVPTEPIGSDIVVTYTPTFTVAQTLASGASQEVVIRVEYVSSSTNQSPISEDFGVVVTYTQDTE